MSGKAEKLAARLAELERERDEFRHKLRRALAIYEETECRLRRHLAEARAEVEWLWARCQIICWPGEDGYPLEHNPSARKDMREHIEALMQKELREEDK